MKHFFAFLSCTLFLALGAQAPAQTALPAPALTVPAGGSVTFAWTAPTKNSDGSAIGSGLVYNLYNVSSSGVYTLLQGGITGLSNTRSNLNAGQPCYALSAAYPSGGESTKTPTICINVVSIPSVPTGWTVTITVSSP